MNQEKINRVRSAINFAPTYSNDIKLMSASAIQFDVIISNATRKTGLTPAGVRSLFVEYEINKSPSSVYFLTSLVEDVCNQLDSLYNAQN